MPKNLSKSKIIAGLQCEKRLWLEVNKPELVRYSAATELRFASGNEVQEVARGLHANGRLIAWQGRNAARHALAETRKWLQTPPLLASEAPLFEATFAFEHAFVRVDILQPLPDRTYRLIEVKSSSEVKPQYYPDCAVQTWTAEGNGVPISSVQLAHVDTSFVYRGDGDYNGLLHFAELTDNEKFVETKRQVPGWVAKFSRAAAAANEPNIAVGRHCHKPYSCPFLDYCTPADAPQYPVGCLPGKGEIVDALQAEGIHDIRDIPPGRIDAGDKRGRRQEWVRRVTAAGKAELHPDARAEIADLPYPRYYLDFETLDFAVPVWADTRPFQKLPFQWSCHVESAPGAITHREFLHDDCDAPMHMFTESLLAALGDAGPVFVYSPYEKTILRQMASRFARRADAIETLIARLVDLKPITERNYYHPDMHGSWSLKAVLPSIAPHLRYDDLGEVQGGLEAGPLYWEMVQADTDAARRRQLRDDLLAYCKLDTYALVALAKFLCGEEV